MPSSRSDWTGLDSDYEWGDVGCLASVGVFGVFIFGVMGIAAYHGGKSASARAAAKVERAWTICRGEVRGELSGSISGFAEGDEVDGDPVQAGKGPWTVSGHVETAASGGDRTRREVECRVEVVDGGFEVIGTSIR
ncbi:MAG: hypothetical protein ABEL76_15530 [Bradymonadaceae bacterium]